MECLAGNPAAIVVMPPLPSQAALSASLLSSLCATLRASSCAALCTTLCTSLCTTLRATLWAALCASLCLHQSKPPAAVRPEHVCTHFLQQAPLSLSLKTQYCAINFALPRRVFGSLCHNLPGQGSLGSVDRITPEPFGMANAALTATQRPWQSEKDLLGECARQRVRQQEKPALLVQ